MSVVNLTELTFVSSEQAHTSQEIADRFANGQSVAAQILGWKRQVRIETKNGQQVEVPQKNRQKPYMPIYQPTGTTHYDTSLGYTYDIVVDDIMDDSGRAFWDLQVYFTGEPDEPVMPVLIFERRYAKADHRLERIRGSYAVEAIRTYSDQKAYEWAHSAHGRAVCARWAASPAAIASAKARHPYCQRDLNQAQAVCAKLRRSYREASDEDERSDLERRGKNAKAVYDLLRSELLRLESFMKTPQERLCAHQDRLAKLGKDFARIEQSRDDALDRDPQADVADLNAQLRELRRQQQETEGDIKALEAQGAQESAPWDQEAA